MKESFNGTAQNSSTPYERRALANMAELLTQAHHCLIEGTKTQQNSVESAIKMYEDAIFIINVYFQHASIDNLVGNPSSAFYYQAEAFYSLGILYYQGNNFKEAHDSFMKSTLTSIQGLKATPDRQDRREVYFRTIKDSLIYLRAIFKKNEKSVHTTKYLNEYIPLLKEEFMLNSSGKECEELKKILKKLISYFIPLPVHGANFWNMPVSAKIGDQNLSDTKTIQAEESPKVRNTN